MQVHQFLAHVQPQLGVEGGERLVEQEQARARNHGAAKRDTLLLPARQLRRLAVEQRLDLQLPRDRLDLLAHPAHHRTAPR